MNRYIVVNSKANPSSVWATIGDNYTPSKGEVCIIVPPSDAITNTTGSGTSTQTGGVFATDQLDANGNPTGQVTLHANGADENVYPVSIKIGDGSTIFRDLPALTSGNVQGDWKTTDPTNPSYIRNKPILNDDLFQQGNEKTLLISSAEILNLFNITYNKINSNLVSRYLTRRERMGIEYIVSAGEYDINDYTNPNTSVFMVEGGKASITAKVKDLNSAYNLKNTNGEFTSDEITYLTNLITTGEKVEDKDDAFRGSIVRKITALQCAEDITVINEIIPNENAQIKIFKGENYVKISNHYFHPNDLLIYNDNNWGFYEMRMYGLTDYRYSFTNEEVEYLTPLINGTLMESSYLYIAENLKGFLTSQIETIIDVSAYKVFLQEKMKYILPRISQYDLIEAIRSVYAKTTIPDIANKTTNELLTILVKGINEQIKLEEDANIGITKADLLSRIRKATSDSLEINKQPRFWFYKSNILKQKEKQVITQMIKDAIFIYNNKFNKEQQEILLSIANDIELPKATIEKLQAGYNEIIINKIRFNNDITASNGKIFLINRLQFKNDATITEEARRQLIKQITVSTNSLDTVLDEDEINEITDEVLNELTESLSLFDENDQAIENTIIEGYNGENVYYEINNEIILDTADRAIYMRLDSLKGYLKQTKNLEIVFHYRTRSLNADFMSELIADWDQTDPEEAGYIAHKPVWRDTEGQVHTELWFLNWLSALVVEAIENYYNTNIKPRLDDLDNRLNDLENKYNDLASQVKNIQNLITGNFDSYLKRITSLIVSQPTQPVLSTNFMPKIWICTDTKSGYGLVYWRNGGEDSQGNYNGTTATWRPVSAIWSPDSITQ